MRAMRRAYERAGFGPETLGLVEAHGTGTAVGDRAETETVVRTLREHGTPARECAIGSVKTLIGHTKATAGAAGLIKVALSLHHKVLPPHCNVTNPIEPIADPGSPVYLCKDARPWVRHPDHPRRGAVSSFGFGGTNFHAVLEEYAGDLRPAASVSGAQTWPCELLVFRADSQHGLHKQLESLQAALQAGAEPRLADLAFSLALRADERRTLSLTLVLVVDGLEQLRKTLTTLLAGTGFDGAPLPPNVAFGERLPDPKLAFVFPGQGAQYPDMAREAMMFLPEVRQALELADQRLRSHYPKRLSQYIFPPGAFSDAEENENLKCLTDTHVAQPAIGTVAIGFLDFLARMGLEPDMVAGHSYGEYVALHAAGAISRDALLDISEIRGRIMAGAGEAGDAGTMAAVHGDRAAVTALLGEYAGVGVANHNSPSQCVISGPTESVRRAAEQLTQQGFNTRLLSVSAAFHSSLVAGAQPALDAAIAELGLQEPRVPLYSNTTAKAYPHAPREMQALLSRHMLSPVEFVEQVRNMYEDGARVFVELGPKSTLTRMIAQSIEGKPHAAVCIGGGGDLRGVLLALGTLAARGAPVALCALFDHRLVQALNLDRLAETSAPKPLAATAWYLAGGGVRRPDEPAVRTGKDVALTAATRAQEQSQFLEKLASDRMPPVPAAQYTPAAPASPSIPAVSLPAPAGAAAAWTAYQQTMRQFLSLQEQVMRQFLGADAQAPGATAPVLSGSLLQMGPVAAPQFAERPVGSPPASTPLTAPIASGPAAPPPAAAPQGGGLNREDMGKVLLALVSERTGYPVEMLGLTQDLEAELGIDSIKRVEILGALQKQLPAALAESVRASMEQFTRVKTLSALLDRLGAAMPAQPATTPLPAAAPQGGGPNREDMGKMLLALVSERTGYPVEMLGLTQDLEAELGIDSIKRVEILGALQKQLPAALAESVRASMEQFTRVKTLSALLDRLGAAASAQPAAGLPPASPAHAAAAPAAGSESMPEPTQPGAHAPDIPLSITPRYLVVPRLQPLPAVSVASLPGLYLVLGGKPELSAVVIDSLRRRGADACAIDQTALGDPEQLTERVATLRAGKGPLTGVIHLAGLIESEGTHGLAEWRELAAQQTKSLFEVLKHSTGDLSQGGRVLAATAFGGRFGRDDKVTATAATAAGVSGLLKSLAVEWPAVIAKVVDLDPAASAEGIAGALIQELLAADGEVEVGYAGGSRYVFRVTAAPFPDPRPDDHRLDDDSVVLVTAGARGITAAVVSRLARSSFTLVVVGRRPEPAADADRFPSCESRGRPAPGAARRRPRSRACG